MTTAEEEGRLAGDMLVGRGNWKFLVCKQGLEVDVETVIFSQVTVLTVILISS